jgi:hypothetical protein
MASILAFLGFSTPPESTDSDTIRRIAGQLDQLEPEQARYAAAFAFVLSRLASADHEVTADEAQTMERLVREKGALPTRLPSSSRWPRGNSACSGQRTTSL